jgi:hypothetical protein
MITISSVINVLVKKHVLYNRRISWVTVPFSALEDSRVNNTQSPHKRTYHIYRT